MSSISIPSPSMECLRAYVQNMVAMLALLYPEIIPDDRVTTHIQRDSVDVWFEMKLLLGYPFL